MRKQYLIRIEVLPVTNLILCWHKLKNHIDRQSYLSNTPSKKYVWKEFTGKGNIIFQSGAICIINFETYIMDSGRLVGSILFTTIDSSLNDELNRNQTFTVSNEAQNQNRLMISAEQCAFYSIRADESKYNTLEKEIHDLQYIALTKTYAQISLSLNPATISR